VGSPSQLLTTCWDPVGNFTESPTHRVQLAEHLEGGVGRRQGRRCERLRHITACIGRATELAEVGWGRREGRLLPRLLRILLLLLLVCHIERPERPSTLCAPWLARSLPLAECCQRGA